MPCTLNSSVCPSRVISPSEWGGVDVMLSNSERQQTRHCALCLALLLYAVGSGCILPFRCGPRAFIHAGYLGSAD
jgi:hypothetical protein